MKKSNGNATKTKDGYNTGPKTFARLRSRSPTREKGGLDLLQVPLAGSADQRSMLDETIATDVTRASSRNNIREVDIEMVQIALKNEAEAKQPHFYECPIIVTEDQC